MHRLGCDLGSDSVLELRDDSAYVRLLGPLAGLELHSLRRDPVGSDTGTGVSGPVAHEWCGCGSSEWTQGVGVRVPYRKTNFLLNQKITGKNNTFQNEHCSEDQETLGLHDGKV